MSYHADPTEVALVHSPSYAPHKLRENVDDLFALLGADETLIEPNDTVVIKPNWIREGDERHLLQSAEPIPLAEVEFEPRGERDPGCGHHGGA